MTALAPFSQATTGPLSLVDPNTPKARRRAAGPASEVPGVATFVAVVVAIGFAALAVLGARFPVFAIPCGVTAVAIVLGVLVPDAYGRRLDRQRAAQGDL